MPDKVLVEVRLTCLVTESMLAMKMSTGGHKIMALNYLNPREGEHTCDFTEDEVIVGNRVGQRLFLPETLANKLVATGWATFELG